MLRPQEVQIRPGMFFPNVRTSNGIPASTGIALRAHVTDAVITAIAVFDRYIYDPADAEHEYRMSLADPGSGNNITAQEAKPPGEIIQPLLKKGLSAYAILQAHPEIKQSEKTQYTYIGNKVFEGRGAQKKRGSRTCVYQRPKAGLH